jgi:hypothetical protein
MGNLVRRGLVAGLVAGFGAGVFYFVVSEPFIAQALRFEVVPAGGASVEVFSRAVQRGGLLAATTLYGAALGGVFGFVFAFIAPRMHDGSVWDHSLRLAAGGFAAAWLVPFLKYPTNPPAVGDPETIGSRTALYVTMIAISLAAATAAWTASRRLSARGVERHRRHLAVAGGYVGIIGAAYALLPGNSDPIDIPAKLLWSVRLTSAAGQALLWLLIGAIYGVLSTRAGRAERGLPMRIDEPVRA